MTIEGRLGGIGNFTMPDTPQDLREICGKPIQVGKGWTVSVASVNEAKVPLSKIAVKPPKEREKKFPVRFRGQKKVEISLKKRGPKLRLALVRA